MELALERNASLIEWDEPALSQFGRKPLRLMHQVHRHELFSDEALARLLDNPQRGDYYVNTMNIDAHDTRSRREGEIRDLPGRDVLRAVAEGRLWILFLRPERAEPRYEALLEEIYREIASHQPGFSAKHLKLSILISSPNIQVYYHSDIPGQSLWQVRGRKRVYVYPNHEPFLGQAALERIAAGEAHEFSLPYDPSFDEHATIYDIEPGQMLHWPLHCPHRIVNGDCLNVSFTTEHFTPAIRRNFIVQCANNVLRQRFGREHLSQDTTGPGYWAKFGLAAAWKLSGSRKRRRKVLDVDFRVDPEAPGGVRDIEPYEYHE